MAQTATLEELERQAHRLGIAITPQDDGSPETKYWLDHAWQGKLFIGKGLRETEIYLNGFEAGSERKE